MDKVVAAAAFLSPHLPMVSHFLGNDGDDDYDDRDAAANGL